MAERLSDRARMRMAAQLGAEGTDPNAPGASALDAALFAAAPGLARLPAKALASIAGALIYGTPTATAQDGMPQPTDLGPLYKQREVAEQRRQAAERKQAEAEARMQAEGRTGRGPRFVEAEAAYRDAQAAFQSATAEANALRSEIERGEQRNSPEYLIGVKKQQQAAADARDLELRKKPFNEKYREIAEALPGLGIAAGMILPALGRTAFLRAKNAPIRDWHVAARETEDALRRRDWMGRPNPDIAAAQRGADTLAAANKKYQSGTVDHGPELPFYQPSKGMIASGMLGGSLAAEGTMFPDQFDAAMMPEGPEKDAARSRALNPWNYLERGAMGALSGASGYKLGGMLYPDIQGPLARSKALAGRYAGEKAGPTAIRDAEMQNELTAALRGARPQQAGPAPVPQPTGQPSGVPGTQLVPVEGQPLPPGVGSNRGGRLFPFGGTVKEQQQIEQSIIDMLLGRTPQP